MLLPHSPPSICTIHSFVWFLLENVETFMRFFAFCLCYNKSLWFYAILRLLLILVVVSVFIRFYERHSYYFLIVAFSSLAGYAPKPKHLLITTKPKKMKINKVEKCSQFFFTFSSPTNWNCYGGLFIACFLLRLCVLHYSLWTNCVNYNRHPCWGSLHSTMYDF